MTMTLETSMVALPGAPPGERPVGAEAGRAPDRAASAVMGAPPPVRFPAEVKEPKVTVRHLARQALIYIRQSSPTQIQRHPESARRQ